MLMVSITRSDRILSQFTSFHFIASFQKGFMICGGSGTDPEKCQHQPFGSNVWTMMSARMIRGVKSGAQVVLGGKTLWVLGGRDVSSMH